MMAAIKKTAAQLFVTFIFFANVIDAAMKNATSMKEHPVAHIHRDLDKETIVECIVSELGIFAEPGTQSINTPQSLICSTEDMHGPTIMLIGDYISFFKGTLRPGVTSLSIPTELVSTNMVVDLDGFLASEVISVSNEIGKRELRGRQTPRRSLIPDYDGFFKVLVVRVSDKNGNSPTYNATEISNSVFFDNVSMASQYRACSNDQLSFTPAFGGTDIKDGVVDVTVDVNLLDKSPIECVNAADSAILRSSYDVGTSHSYTMYICPDVVDFGDLPNGFADIGGKKSWYSDTSGSNTSITMHGIGHNLGLFYSGEGVSDYGDPTCVMGGMYETELGWGRMCFNAAKTWHLGWYSDQHADVTPTLNAYSGELVDVNSVFAGNTNKTDHVVVKVDDDSEQALYIMLHRLEGITSDMKEAYIDEHADRVNIIRPDSDADRIDSGTDTGPAGYTSRLVGSLASGEDYCQDNWSNTRRALHIKVSSIAESSQEEGAKVSVFLDDEGYVCDCQDSPLFMKVNYINRNCAWVARTKTNERCEKKGVASHCPVTCKAEKMCQADSQKRFKLKGTSDIQGCSWVERKFTKHRCQKMEGVASTCRATCAQFMNEIILY